MKTAYTDTLMAIEDIVTCDFDTLRALSNEDIFSRSKKSRSKKLLAHIEAEFSIKNRYHCQTDQSALDLARQAMANLMANNPDLSHEADFLIYAGISNPLPAVTLSALLADEFKCYQASCQDIKSGCSTALLAFNQACQLIASKAAKKGIIVSAENLSRFADPDQFQMSMTIGDGAVAMVVSDRPDFELLYTQHGTDARASSFMRVNREFPAKTAQLEPYYTFSNKPEAVKLLQKYWLSSLETTLQDNGLSGQNISHYIAHQVDPVKNQLIAQAFGIPESATATNFECYGNMGSPTIFVNLYQWLKNHRLQSSENMLLQAVGGGISYATALLKKV